MKTRRSSKGLMSITLLAISVSVNQCRKENSDLDTSQSAASKDEKEQNGDSKLESLLEKARSPVQMKSIERRSVQNTYRSSSILSANHDVELMLPVGDTVSEIYKMTGDHVEEGEPIARLESSEVAFARRKAKLSHREAERIHQASQQLFRERHISRDDFEKTRLELLNAKIQLDEAEKKHRDLTVRSPFTGVVAHNNLVLHAHRTRFADKPPIRVVASQSLIGSFSLPVVHHQAIQPNLQLTLVARGSAHTATVTHVAPVVDESTGTFAVRFSVANPSGSLYPGERANLEIPIGTASQRLVLPPDSVVFAGNKPYVFVIRDPTEEEVESDVRKIQKDSPPPGKKQQELTDHEKPASRPTDKTKDNTTDKTTGDDKFDESDIRRLAKLIPRAKKIPVVIDQLPSGEYALVEKEIKEGSRLKEGTELVVLGLYQIADADKVRVVESL